MKMKDIHKLEARLKKHGRPTKAEEEAFYDHILPQLFVKINNLASVIMLLSADEEMSNELRQRLRRALM